jgi:hypothetical protein
MIILRILNSPYANDLTRNAVLSHQDVDNNFIYLKGHIIYESENNGGLVTLKKYNGETISFANGGSTFTGGTVNGATIFTGGLTANTFSATTYYNLPTDVRVTGGTYNSGTITFINNTNGTFTVTGLSSTDTFVTGYTYSSTSNTFTIKQNQGQSDLTALIDTMSGLTVNGLLSATIISGDTIYAVDFPQLPFTDNETVEVYSAGGDTFLRVKDVVSAPSGGTRTFNGNINITSGLTVNGSITTTTFSATTYYNLPTDVRVTGGTYNNNTGITTFTNNTGGTFTVTGFKTDDLVVTGGTYSNGTATFTNNTGGTFSVTGFSTDTSSTDTYTTGFTYNNTNTFTLTNNTGGTLTTTINTMTGLTVNGVISATTISGTSIYANDFPQLPYTDGQTIDYFMSGSTTYIRVKDSVSAPSGGIRTFIGNVNITSGLTINGNLTFTGQSNNIIYSAGTVTSTHIPNWNNSNIQTVILSAATTNISGGTNIANGAVYTMIIKQNSIGSNTINWGSEYKWQSGIAPVLTSTANAVDILTFISDGTNLYGLIAKDFR